MCSVAGSTYCQIKRTQQSFPEELSQREEQLNTYIMNQDELLKEANEDIMKLKNRIDDFTNKRTDMKSTQTKEKKKAVKQTQTQHSFRNNVTNRIQV